MRRSVDQDGGTGALWVFSPYACGVYGFGSGVVIVSERPAATQDSFFWDPQKTPRSVPATAGYFV